MAKTISIVVPAYNEEECVDKLVQRLGEIADGLKPNYEFEYIIVENGSADTTFQRLMALRDADPRLKIIRFSKNFGMEGAVTAGLRHAAGDAAIIMCADLQDPPEVIPRFIEQWEKGYDNVYGVITKRSDESWLRQRLTSAFYWILHRAHNSQVPQNVSDFRLVSRKVYSVMNTLTERHRMLRAMWSWVGYKSIGVEHERPPRAGGKSTYRLFRNIAFALHGICASTITPLKLIPMAGMTCSALSFLGLAVLAVRWLAFGVPFNGFGTIVALQLGLFGLLFLLLGILSEYVGMTFEEVRGRPMYIIDTQFGFGTTPATATTITSDSRVLESVGSGN